MPVLVKKADSGECLRMEEESYLVKDYACGYVMSDTEDAAPKELLDVIPLDGSPELPKGDIPPIPDMAQWVSVKKYGAVGDGVTDDTAALQRALDAEEILYFPQGIYRITDTLRMRKNSCLYGLSPISTQIVIVDDTPAFGGFGTPMPASDSGRRFRIHKWDRN